MHREHRIKSLKLRPFFVTFVTFVAKKVFITRLSKFISYLPEKFFPMGLVSGCFNSLWRITVYDAHNSPPLRGFSNNDLNRVGGCTVDAADLGAELDLREDVYREGVLQDDTEDVTGPDRLKIFDAKVCKRTVVSFCSDKTWTGGFSEGYAEKRIRDGRGDDLIEVFGCFDKMCLAEYYIAAFRQSQLYSFYFHRCSSIS